MVRDARRMVQDVWPDGEIVRQDVAVLASVLFQMVKVCRVPRYTAICSRHCLGQTPTRGPLCAGENAHYGTPNNAAAPGRVPGGSSSGSAVRVALMRGSAVRVALRGLHCPILCGSDAWL